MATYRAYRIDRSGRIRAGAWIEAGGDLEARDQALSLCDGMAIRVEVWQGGRLVCDLGCDPADPAGG